MDFYFKDKTVIPIPGKKPTSQIRHTWFQPMVSALAVWE